MGLTVRPGVTGYTTKIFVQDTRLPNVAGLTGLAFNTAGLTWYYHRAGDATATAVVPATATVGTWTSGGFKEIDPTHLPGWYELGIPNAALAAGDVGLSLYGAANMGEVNLLIQTQGVPLDLTQAVPSTNAAQTIGDALLAARVGGFSKAVIDLTAKTWTLYAADGVTAVRTFTLTLDANGNVTTRT